MQMVSMFPNKTSHENGYSLGQARACILLGFLHTLLLGLGIFSLIACCGGLSGTDYFAVLALGLSLLIMEVLAWALLRRVHFMLLFLGIGCGISLLLSVICFALTARFENIRSALALATFVLCMIIILTHASARAKHGEIKADFLATHDDDVPFRMELWEVPTLLTTPSPWCMLWFAAQYVVGLIAKQPLYWRTVFYLALLDLFVCFAFYYIRQFTVFLQDNHTSANLPVRTIRRVHLILLAVGTLLLVLFVTPAVFFNREPLSELTLKVSHLPTSDDVGMAELFPTTATEENPFMEGLIDTGETHEPPEWLKKLMNVLLVVILAGFVIAVIAAIVQAIRFAMRNFAICDEDEVLFLEDETADSVESADSAKTRDDGFFSVNRQIRRRYKKTIQKATSGIPDHWATPSELEAHAGLADSDGISVLHEVYEKARYSRDGATREDAERVIHVET
jgi:hypothetical protein